MSLWTPTSGQLPVDTVIDLGLNAVQWVSEGVLAEELRCHGECWLNSTRMAGMSSQCP